MITFREFCEELATHFCIYNYHEMATLNKLIEMIEEEN